MLYISLDSIIDDLSREKNKLISAYLDKYSLGNGQFQILNEVGWHDGISQEGIASIRKTDKSAVAKSVKSLIKKGYLYKERNDKDKRAFCLHCTLKGKMMIPKITGIVNKVDNILIQDLSENEVEQFKTLCKKMQKNVINQINSKNNLM